MAKCNCGQDGQDPHLPTCPLFRGLRGIDSKRRLLGFFGAKGHHNLVLRIVDVLEMRPESLVQVAGLVMINGGGVEALDGGNLKGWFLDRYPDGYITIPIDRLLEPLPLPEVEKVQALIAEYRDIRMGKGSPSKTESCPKCGGRIAPARCENCDGSGKIVIFLEMADEEIALALRRRRI